VSEWSREFDSSPQLPDKTAAGYPFLQYNILKALKQTWDFKSPDTYFVGSNYTPDKRLQATIDAQLIVRQVMRQHNDGIIPSATSQSYLAAL